MHGELTEALRVCVSDCGYRLGRRGVIGALRFAGPRESVLGCNRLGVCSFEIIEEVLEQFLRSPQFVAKGNLPLCLVNMGCYDTGP
jgi:hypothetical protein